MSASRDPRRLLESADDLSAVLGNALRAERADRGAAPDRLRSIEQSLARRLDGEPAAHAETAARTGLQLLTRRGAWLALAGVGIVAVGVLASRGWGSSSGSVADRLPIAPNTVLVERRPLAVLGAGSGVAVAQSADHAVIAANDLPPASHVPIPSAGARPVAAPAPAAAVANDDGAEIALLARAHDALQVDPAGSLVLCQEHESRFARGHFAQEREAVAIEALVYLNRRSEASRRFDEFSRRYPTSSHRIHLTDLLSPSP